MAEPVHHSTFSYTGTPERIEYELSSEMEDIAGYEIVDSESDNRLTLYRETGKWEGLFKWPLQIHFDISEDFVEVSYERESETVVDGENPEEIIEKIIRNTEEDYTEDNYTQRITEEHLNDYLDSCKELAELKIRWPHSTEDLSKQPANLFSDYRDIFGDDAELLDPVVKKKPAHTEAVIPSLWNFGNENEDEDSVNADIVLEFDSEETYSAILEGLKEMETVN